MTVVINITSPDIIISLCDDRSEVMLKSDTINDKNNESSDSDNTSNSYSPKGNSNDDTNMLTTFHNEKYVSYKQSNRLRIVLTLIKIMMMPVVTEVVAEAEII